LLSPKNYSTKTENYVAGKMQGGASAVGSSTRGNLVVRIPVDTVDAGYNSEVE
jgi:hypothetical protein